MIFRDLKYLPQLATEQQIDLTRASGQIQRYGTSTMRGVHADELGSKWHKYTFRVLSCCSQVSQDEELAGLFFDIT